MQNMCDFREEDSRKCIRLYNKVAQALLDYQYLYHHAWMQSIPAVVEALSVSTLSITTSNSVTHSVIDCAMHCPLSLLYSFITGDFVSEVS